MFSSNNHLDLKLISRRIGSILNYDKAFSVHLFIYFVYLETMTF